MATARIRKAFRYPDDNEDEPLELDEEEQEKLIADLQQQDTDNSNLYRTIFPVIPAAAALYSLLAIFTAGDARERLVTLLSLSSLVATTYLFVVFPLANKDDKGKRPAYLAAQDQSPIAVYLPWLNAALAGILLLSALANYLRDSVDRALQEALPAGMDIATITSKLTRTVILGITLFVREQLRPLNWSELQQARYELKGA